MSLAFLDGRPAFDRPLAVGAPIVEPDTRVRYAELMAQAFERNWLTNDGPLVRQLEQEIARRQRLTPAARREQIIDQILAATRYRCMQPRHRMADMFVHSHQCQACTHRIDKPLNRFPGGRCESVHQAGTICGAASTH